MRLSRGWIVLGLVGIMVLVALLQADVVVSPVQAVAPQGKDQAAKGKSLSFTVPIWVIQLLMDKDSHKELKLTAEQVKKADGLIAAENAAVANIRTYDAEARTAMADQAVGDMLDKTQGKRLAELRLQAKGPRVLLTGSVSDALKLTAEQKTKLEESLDKNLKKQMEEKKAGTIKGDTTKHVLSKINRKVLEAMIEDLTKEQKDTVTEKLGTIYQNYLPLVDGVVGLDVPPGETLTPPKKG